MPNKILDVDTKIGLVSCSGFNLYTDWIYEIGFNAKPMDAMSHLELPKMCAHI